MFWVKETVFKGLGWDETGSAQRTEMSGVAGAKRRGHIARELEGPTKIRLCWIWNPLYSGSNEKPLEGSKKRVSLVVWHHSIKW